MLGKLLRRKSRESLDSFSALRVDFHSHLIPAIDDGSDDIDSSAEMIRGLKDLGFEKIITTPHITPGMFDNTEDDIRERFTELKHEIENRGIEIELDIGAEYFIDESFMDRIEKNDSLLTFSDNYILVETAFAFEPPNLKEVLFALQSEGYKPILAHPERYMYMHSKSLESYNVLKERGVLFQLNTGSLVGAYSKIVQKVAYKLIDEGMIDFIGSDLHKASQLEVLSNALSDQHLFKLVESGRLKNPTL